MTTDLNEGQTLHSLRAVLGENLGFSGLPLTDMMGRVGWASNQTASYYMNLASVLPHDSPSHLLAEERQDVQEIEQLTIKSSIS